MGSIRARLTAGFAVALIGTMVLFVLALLIAREEHAKDLADERVRSELTRTVGIIDRIFLRNPSSPFITFSDSTASPYDTPLDSATIAANDRLRRLLELSTNEYILISDQSGRISYRSPMVRAFEKLDSARGVSGTSLSDSARFESVARGVKESESALFELSGRKIMLRIAKLPPNGRIDKVWVGLSADDARFAPSGLVAVMLVVAPVLLALSLSGAYFLAGRAFQPVDEIIDQVEAITDGRSLHRRLAVGESQDELSRLSSTLNAMIERLETSFGALRRFTADASHELKTPLTVIRADVERSMSPNSTRAEKEIAMEEALQQVARMADLVNSLLLLARADEGRLDLHREPVQVIDIARDVVETARLLGEGAGLTIDVPILENAEVQGDATRLRQLFVNLVENAIKYSAQGGRVEITLARAEGEVQFAVRDNGIGIAAADLPFIFERFWRADRARSRASERGGNGLGLAICQWIAHAHGGSLTVESRLGRGSRFVAHLPLASESA